MSFPDIENSVALDQSHMAERKHAQSQQEKDPRTLTLTVEAYEDGTTLQKLFGTTPDAVTFIILGLGQRRRPKTFPAGTQVNLTATTGLPGRRQVLYDGRIGDINVARRTDEFEYNQLLAERVFNRFATPKTTKFP